MPPLKSLLGWMGLLAALAVNAVADDWSNLATVSMTNATTPKLTNRYACYTDGRDIRCDSPSLYITTGGLVGINTNNPQTQLEVNGTISATNFVGDGSGLTNLSVSGDRITSGTAPVGVIVNSGTSYISLTNGATTWGYFGASNNYLPNMGIGSAPVNTILTVSGTDLASFTGTSALQPLTLKGGGTVGNWRGIDFRTYGSWPIGRIGLQYTAGGSYLGFGTSNNYANGITNQALTIDPQGRVGIGTNSPSVQLHISGSSIVAARIEGDLQGRLVVQANGASANQRIYEVMADAQGMKFSNINDAESVRTVFGTFSPSGFLGIGKVTPVAKLDVSGTISASDAIQVGQSTLACANGISGSIRYNTTSGTIQVCNGTGWISLSSGTSAGVSSLAALTDTNITNLAGRDYLRYDAGTSKWVNISESTVMSTTTMVSGWPDAIMCTNGSDNMVLYYNNKSGGVGYHAPGSSTATGLWVVFNTNGTYAGNTGLTGYDCVTGAKSIATLYAEGKSFNFIGNSNVASNALGDRITSGTAPIGVIVNSATSYISLTSAATTWGYFGAASSYLPAMSTNLVSSSNISSTYVQIQSATTVLACNSGLTGTMRYTSGTMQVCNGTSWGNIGIGVPTGTIAAFNASSCPTGWSEYTASRGRFLRGIDNGAGNDPSGTRSPGDMQTDGVGHHEHFLRNASNGDYANYTNGGALGGWGLAATSNNVGASRLLAGSASNATYNNNTTIAETRPKNVAVTFCRYDGYQSELQAGVSKLASLSDVSVAGATNGQALVYSGGTWIASTTTGGASAASGTGAVQFSTGSNLGGDAGNFFWDNAAKELGIGTNAPGAKLDVRGTISASDAIQVSGSSLTCATGLKGAMRYSNTSSTIEYCNGTNWSSMGPSATVAFLSKGSATQGSLVNGSTLNFNTVVASYGSDITASGNRITLSPGSAYKLEASVRGTGTTGIFDFQIYDVTHAAVIGVMGATTPHTSAGSSDAVAAAFVYPTEATTYEVRVVGAVGTVGMAGGYGYFNAYKLGGGGTGGGGGGGATPAGSTKDIQFNTSGALDADTGLFVYDKTNHRLGVGNSAPSEQLVVGDDLGDVFTGTAAVIGSSASNVGLLLGKDTNNWGRFKWNNGGTGFEISTKQSGVQYDTMQFVNGKVGVGGVSSPAATLQVSGTISASDAIQVSGSSLTCSAGIKGAIRYSNTSSTIEYCQGTAWVSMGPSATDVPAFSAHKNGTNQTVTASTFTKVTFSTELFDTQNNFDTATGRFTPTVAGKYLISGRAACTNATTYCHVAIYKNGSSIAASNSYSANYMVTDVGAVVVDMNGTTDYVELWVSNGGGTTIGGNTDYTNFTGTLIASGNGLAGGGGGATPAGSSNDVQYNSSGALAADTGNFTYASGVLTAPTMSTGAMTVTGQVSASLISTTYVQIQSATSVLACGANLTGTMRYTSGTMQVCNGSAWGNIGMGVPTGTIAAFSAASCPSGWTEYTAARGRFLRGIDNGASVDPSGTRAPANTQEDAIQNITGSLKLAGGGGGFDGFTGAFYASITGTNYVAAGWTGSAGNYGGFDASRVVRTSTETRPKNVAVIFCQYAGFQSALATGVATLASLSDVSVAGATNGQALVYSGGTWIASTTTGGASAASGTGAVQFSTGSNLGGDAGNFFWDNAAKELGIGTNAPGAKLDVRGTISVSDVIQVSGSSLTCNSGLKGAMRYSNTSSTIEYCQGTAWISMGPSDTRPVGFAAHKNGTNQTVTSWTPTKLTWNTEDFDVGNNFNTGTGRFTPTVAGNYFVTASVYCSGVAYGCQAAIYKNGSQYRNIFNGKDGGSNSNPIVTTIVSMNGTTDYIEAWGQAGDGTVIEGDARYTNFAASLLGPQSGGGGGATNLAGLTDTNITNVSGRDYLRYDAGTSKWVNISESTVMSTTTMTAGWPDALKCNVTNPNFGPSIFLLTFSGHTPDSGNFYYRLVDPGLYTGIKFASSGGFVGYESGITTTDCNQSIGQLYAAGKAFNFIGSANAGGNALGDRITSGTAPVGVIVNSATSYISLTNGATTWGYLGAGSSYLPGLSSNNISSTGVLQVSGSSLTCNSGLKGAMRYSNTSNTIEYCNSSAWTGVGPSGSIVAFGVNKGGTAQTVTTGTTTPLTWSVESVDTNNNFASNKFTPTVPGYYFLSLNVRCANASDYCISFISKNGSTIADNRNRYSSGDRSAYSSALVYANGSTDYFEAAVFMTGTSVDGGAANTNFSGFLLSGGGNGSGGGSATPAGSSNDVQYNSSGALAADTGNFTYASGVLSAPRISSTNISASGVVQVSGSSLTCGAGLKGAMRYSNTSSTIEYCQGTAWVSMGPSETTVPAFSVNKGGTNQTGIPTNTYTLLTWSNEVFDTQNSFSGNRFTPLVKGKYLISLTVNCVAGTAQCYAGIYKNGAAIHQQASNPANSGEAQATATAIVDLNGSTDYIEGWVYNSGNSVSGAAQHTYMTGTLIASGNGLAGGGSATPAGSTGDIQFNNAGALAADTGKLFWDATNDRLGVGTGTPAYPLEVNGGIAATDYYQSSDRNLKEDITQLTSGLAVVDKLNPVRFRWKASGKFAYGLIAQDVEQVLPEAVAKDGRGNFVIEYSQLTPWLIQGLKELKAANDNLEAENATLRRDLDAVMERVNTLEQRAGGRR